MALKLFRILSVISVFVWILAGLITWGSLAYGTTGLYLIVAVGAIFLFLGCYFLVRRKSISRMATYSPKDDALFKNTFSKFLRLENLLVALQLLLGLLILSAVLSRTLGEQLPVFD